MASDLAAAIIKTSKEAFEEACKANECKVYIAMRRNRAPFEITVTPTDQHIVFHYGGVQYRVQRADRAGFQDILDCLYGMMHDRRLQLDREDENNPSFDEDHYYMRADAAGLGEGDPYEESSIKVVQGGQVKAELGGLPLSEIKGVFMHHMGAMRFLSC